MPWNGIAFLFVLLWKKDVCYVIEHFYPTGISGTYFSRMKIYIWCDDKKEIGIRNSVMLNGYELHSAGPEKSTFKGTQPNEIITFFAPLILCDVGDQ